MYAVIKTGGKQYRVQPGDLLVVEKLDGEPGAHVVFGEVLMLGNGDDVTLGVPTLSGASVAATLIETRKGEKIKIFKKKRRQGYRRTKGHRQHETVLRVTSIAGADGKEAAKWDGKVDLTTKAELNARARGLEFISPTAQAEAAAARKVQVSKADAPKAPAKAKAAKVVKAADAVVADPAIEAAAATVQVDAPVKEDKAPAKKAAAPKAETKAEAKADAKPKAAPKAAAKAETTEKAAAPKKAAAAPKKDKSAK